MLIDKDIWNE